MQVLWVDKQEARRRLARRVAQGRGVGILEANDAFAAMGALGRADFDVLALAEEPRHLSMRGLLLLAQKRHPTIRLYVLLNGSSDGDALRNALGIAVETVPADQTLESLFDQMEEQLAATQPFELPAAVRQDLAAAPAASEDPTAESMLPADEGDSEEPTQRTSLSTVAQALAPPPAPRPHVPPAPGRGSGPLGPGVVTLHTAPTQPFLPRFTDLPPGAAPSSAATSVDGTPTPSLPRAVPPAPLPQAPAPVELGTPLPDQTQPNAVFPKAPSRPAVQSRTPTDPTPFPAASISTDPAALAHVHLEGDLSQASGAALLLGLFAQELTGRLTIQGGAEGTLYLLRGEPVYAEEPDGDIALWGRCLRAGVLPPNTPRPPVVQGQLASVLASLVSGEALHNVLRSMVRERVLMLAAQREGSYTFDEEQAFLDVVPLFKVNPVGLVVEATRRGRPPDKLLERSKLLEGQYLHPGPGLAAAAPKLTAFLRGGDALALVNGKRTVAQFCADSQLGPLMGTLLVEVLVDARLAYLRDSAWRSNSSEVALRHQLVRAEHEVTQQTPMVPEAELEAATGEDSAVRNHIFSLYARLKPLRVPRQVLGVSPYANRDAIDAAYQRLMAELSTRAIPDGSARALLQSRVEEVRAKVQASYQALLLELSEDDGGTNSNPF